MAWVAIFFFLTGAFFLSPTLPAHDLGALQVQLELSPGGTVRASLALSLDHMATLPIDLDPTRKEPLSPSDLERLGSALADQVDLAVDARPLALRMLGVRQDARTVEVGLEGKLPPGARELSWRYRFNVGPYYFAARRAGESPLVEQWVGDENEVARVDVSGLAPVPTRRDVVRQYLGLGFTHILPYGFDHICFVLGLFLLALRLRPLLVQVTCFTVAHTLTLALSMYGVVQLPSSIVEPMIAVSIAYVGIENLFTRDLTRWRPALVFTFGLLHGLGFAGVLSELGLPRERFATALVAFNVGVELGQLAVLAIAVAAVGWLRRHASYRRWVVLPGSLAIAALALYWTAERTHLF
ncbi:MAG: HupE/UreJ family protein [Thermoanaerobaculia bacterium]